LFPGLSYTRDPQEINAGRFCCFIDCFDDAGCSNLGPNPIKTSLTSHKKKGSSDVVGSGLKKMHWSCEATS